MKNTLLIFLVLLLFSSHSKVQNHSSLQYEDNDTIIWSQNRKLKWNDFKGQPDNNEMNKASTFAGLELMSFYTQGSIPKLNVICYFIKSKSWVKVENEDYLAHEQVHFDIWELYARKIRKSFDSLSVSGNTNILDYHAIFNSYSEKCSNYHNLYDSKVYFNDVRQEEWIKRISVELDKLKRYEVEINDD